MIKAFGLWILCTAIWVFFVSFVFNPLLGALAVYTNTIGGFFVGLGSMVYGQHRWTNNFDKKVEESS